MRKINTDELEEFSWTSPKEKFSGKGRDVSEALGWNSQAPDARDRHPFVVEILRIAPGQIPYPYHWHSAQWEFYHVISGQGLVRAEDGNTPVRAGDAFIFGPGEAHQLINNNTEDLVLYVIADDPKGESGYYPDSDKWIVRSPARRLMRAENLDYYDGEE
ncbi:MAG: cupin domain-containing protein [Chthoniobacterales bacterium]|nr:cupin domain-containing protein [Chthoniobacterales bacterium]